MSQEVINHLPSLSLFLLSLGLRKTEGVGDGWVGGRLVKFGEVAEQRVNETWGSFEALRVWVGWGWVGWGWGGFGLLGGRE